MTREQFEKAWEIEQDIRSLKDRHERYGSFVEAVENDNFKLDLGGVWGSMFLLDDNYVREELKAALKSVLKQRQEQMAEEIRKLGEEFDKI